MREIVPRVYLSSWADACDAHRARACGITHAVNASGLRVDYGCEVWMRRVFPALQSGGGDDEGGGGAGDGRNGCSCGCRGVATLHIAVDDFPTADIARHFGRVNRFIHTALCRDAGARVLVHCMAGQSRSVVLVMAYLAQKRKMNAPAVRQCLVRARVPLTHVNPAFLVQLDAGIARWEALRRDGENHNTVRTPDEHGDGVADRNEACASDVHAEHIPTMDGSSA